MLRPDLLSAIYKSLQSHKYLAMEDFAVAEYSNKEGQPCVSVTYRYDVTLFFKFHVPSKKTRSYPDDGQATYRFNCTFSPGHESVEETLNVDERQGLLDELTKWVERLHADVVALPAVRQFQDHSRAIDELRERLNDFPDEPLSQSDKTAFSEALDRAKEELGEEIKAQAKDKDELKIRVTELSRDIEFLKQTLDSMTKRQWGELLASRVQRWKNRFSLRQLSAGARLVGLLLPGPGTGTAAAVATIIDGVADVAEAGAKKRGAKDAPSEP